MLTRYDMMSSKELRKEVIKRGYTCSWNKVKRIYRHILIEDDLKHKNPIPYIECPNNVSQTLPEVLKS